MVAHLMHESSDGKNAGVAVLPKAGSANNTVRQLWEHMPQTPGKEEVIAGVEVNLAGLLSRDTSYHTHMGSSTAPPCSEGVAWFVLRSPIDLSREVISVFARFIRTMSGPLSRSTGASSRRVSHEKILANHDE
jgi:carbonic anhydrase